MSRRIANLLRTSTRKFFQTRPPWLAPSNRAKFLSTSLATNFPASAHSFYINPVLDNYTDKDLRKLSLNQLIYFGKSLTTEKLITSANYVRLELPVRLAHRIRDFQSLPFKVAINPHISTTYDLYWSAFQAIKKVPKIETIDDNFEFCHTLENLLEEHHAVISKLALGMAEAAQHLYFNQQDIDTFMTKALTSRIARRVVIGQHIALTKQFVELSENNHSLNIKLEDSVGIIAKNCKLYSTVERCAELARRIAAGECGLDPALLPKITINGHTNHLGGSSADPTQLQKCPISVTIAEGADQIVVRISDLAGGFKVNKLDQLFSFARTDLTRRNALECKPCITTKTTPEEDILLRKEQVTKRIQQYQGDDKDKVIIGVDSRLGMGLPVAKTFMLYWGGELEISPLPGLGCDVYLKFPNSKNGSAKEHLPFDPPLAYTQQTSQVQPVSMSM